MKVSISEFPHQPQTMECCRECDGLGNKRECFGNPMNCIDFQLANNEFIEQKRKDLDMHDEICELCSVKRHCKKPGNVKKCSVHKNIVELLKNPVTVKPTPTVEQFERMLAIANEALETIIHYHKDNRNSMLQGQDLQFSLFDASYKAQQAVDKIKNITKC